MDILDGKDIGILGRQQNAIALKYNKSIIITTDILKLNEGGAKGDKDEPSITLDDISHKIDIFAKQILLDGKGSQREAQSSVYGENLVELLTWIIKTIKTHHHPPNAPAIPDFHAEANSRLLNMEYDLLNKQVQTR